MAALRNTGRSYTATTSPDRADSCAAAAIATAILELGRKHNAPVYSQSICRVEPAFVRFRDRLPEIGVANFAVLHGYGTAPAGLVQ